MQFFGFGRPKSATGKVRVTDMSGKTSRFVEYFDDETLKQFLERLRKLEGFEDARRLVFQGENFDVSTAGRLKLSEIGNFAHTPQIQVGDRRLSAAEKDRPATTLITNVVRDGGPIPLIKVPFSSDETAKTFLERVRTYAGYEDVTWMRYASKTYHLGTETERRQLSSLEGLGQYAVIFVGSGVPGMEAVAPRPTVYESPFVQVKLGFGTAERVPYAHDETLESFFQRLRKLKGFENVGRLIFRGDVYDENISGSMKLSEIGDFSSTGQIQVTNRRVGEVPAKLGGSYRRHLGSRRRKSRSGKEHASRSAEHKHKDLHRR